MKLENMQKLMQPKVTVGVCVRNSEVCIGDALESIVSQDFPHELMEVIFVDDGSEDGTLSVINDFVPKLNMEVKVFHHGWKGLGYSRNVVVDNASGEYIIWVDGDMVLSEDFVRKQVDFMEANPSVGIAKGKQSLEPGGNTLATLETYSRAAGRMVDYNSEKVKSKSVGTGGAIYRVTAIRQVGGFDESIQGYGEDMEAEHRLKQLGWLLYTINVYFRDYERGKIFWKDLWNRYLKRGYDLNILSRKRKDLISFYKMLPPAGFIVGFFQSIKIYKLTRRKVAFLLPLQYTFKLSAWCIGYIRSDLSAHT